MIPLSYLIAKRSESPPSSYSSLQLIESETVVLIKAQIPVIIFPQNGKPNICSVTPSYHAR